MKKITITQVNVLLESYGMVTMKSQQNLDLIQINRVRFQIKKIDTYKNITLQKEKYEKTYACNQNEFT